MQQHKPSPGPFPPRPADPRLAGPTHYALNARFLPPGDKNEGLLIRRPPLPVIIGMNEEAHPQPVSIMTSYDWIVLAVGLTACLYFMAMLLWVT